VDGIVPPQRYAQGLAYSEYLAQMGANREHFERNDREFILGPDDEEFFAASNGRLGPIKALALSEDWCPDVQRGLPIVARIAGSAGMELRVFPRDANMDIMDQYLNQGKFASIPTFVFFDRDWRELGQWIERPAAATAIMNEIKGELSKAHLSEEETKREVRKRVAGLWDDWRQETVRELRELLAGR